MTKWEKKIVNYLAKAESDALEGITAGFETGIPVDAAFRELLSTNAEEQQEQEHEDAMGDLNKSAELFPSDNEEDTAVFQLDMDTLHILSDTEPSQHPQQEAAETQDITWDVTVQAEETPALDEQTPDNSQSQTVGTQDSQDTAISTPQHLQHVAALQHQLDTVHQRYFISANRLNVHKIAESKLHQQKLKVDLEIAKMEKVQAKKELK